MKEWIKIQFVNGKPTEVPLTQQELDALDEDYEDFEEDLDYIMDTYDENYEVSPHGTAETSTLKLNRKEVK